MNKKTIKGIVITGIFVLVALVAGYSASQVRWPNLTQGLMQLIGLTEVREVPTRDELTSAAEEYGIDTTHMTDEQINSALKEITSAQKGNSNNDSGALNNSGLK